MINIVTALLLCLFLGGCNENRKDPVEVPPNSPANPGQKDELDRAAQEVLKYSVGLHYQGRFFCSGSIIGEKWVLTAGHCLARLKASEIKLLRVGFGVDQNNPEDLLKVLRVVKPPVYGKKQAGYQPFWDVALVELAQGLPKGYKPVAIASIRPKKLEGTQGYLGGFGVTHYGHTDAGRFKFSKGQVTKYFAKGFRQGMLRIDFDKSGSCSGDSGGGFYFKQNGVWYLLASVSGIHTTVNKEMDEYVADMFVGSFDICQLNQGTFSPFALYSEWINQQVGTTPVILNDVIERKSPSDGSTETWCFDKYLTDDEKFLLMEQVQSFGEEICRGDLLPIVGSEINIDHQVLLDGSILAGLSYLESILIKNSTIRWFPSLKFLTGLKSVVIVNSEIDILMGLADAPELEKVSIIGGRVSAKSLEALFLNNSIEQISIIHSQIELPLDFPEQSDLKILSLRNNNILNVEALRPLMGLQRLNLSGNYISHLDGLESMVQLEVLQLTNNEVFNLSPLKGLKNLKNLSISGNPVDPNTCPSLASEWWGEFCDQL